jgi:hypothetical protein
VTVDVRFSSVDIIGKLRDGLYELPEGATVATLIDAAQREAAQSVPGYALTGEQKENFVFVLDNSPAAYDTGLHDGGKLRVMFKVMGG